MSEFALTSRNKCICKDYIFPADHKDIPGLGGFEDTENVVQYAISVLERRECDHINLYVNGGLAIELLSVVKAAAKCGCSLTVWHWNSAENIYISQEISWQPVLEESQGSYDSAFVLCRGRHVNACESYIFETVSEERRFDFDWQYQRAKNVLKNASGHCLVYLTGLSSLYLSVLNAAGDLRLPITFLHYNYDTEDYFKQPMDK